MSQNVTGEQIFISGLINNYFIIAMYVINLIFVCYGVIEKCMTKIRRKRIINAKKRLRMRMLEMTQGERFKDKEEQQETHQPMLAESKEESEEYDSETESDVEEIKEEHLTFESG